jgi:carbonic anhydrase/acetyltransferase-like protein (isoleucine patch superfamily)
MNKFYVVSYFLIAFSFFIGQTVKGQENIAPKASALKTSFVSTWEKLNAINDGYEPQNSSDKGPAAYGNWNQAANFNKWNWVEYDFSGFYLINQSDVYWWTDGGGIQIPYDTYLSYSNIFTGEWEKPTNIVGNGILADQYNVTTFSPVLTNKIRVYFVSTAAQGILEWKVFGTLQENIPSRSTATRSGEFTKGAESTITLIAKDASGNPVQGYNFSLNVHVLNDISSTQEEYLIDGKAYKTDSLSVVPAATDATGISIVTVSLPATVDPNDGIEIEVNLEGGMAEVASFSYFEPGLIPPVLTADLTENTVDHSIELTFADNASWREKLSSIKVNGSDLTSADYELKEGILVLKPSSGNQLLTKAGVKKIEVKALGYETVTVNQSVNAGAVSVQNSYIDGSVKMYRPSTTKIPVYAYDAYKNPVEGYSFRFDIDVINSDTITSEEYIVEDSEISSNTSGNTMAATDSTGKTTIAVTIPVTVDINDGIRLQLKLADNSTKIGEEKGYIHTEKEKVVYYPKELKGNKEFSWDKTAQSDNFTAFWGSKTGTDPQHALAGSSFDPQKLLSELESYYSFYVDSMKFILNPDSLNMGKYKFVVIFLNTWKSGYKDEGAAYGGSTDDVIGAMWMSPISGFVIAHEFGHACQAMIPIQYPGKGFKNKDDSHQVGMYWEACANYMAYLSSGSTGNMITPLFMNTSMLQYLSTIDSRQYESVYVPAYIIDKFGINALGKQWRSADKGDNPFDAMMKGLGMTREEMRREAGLWAMHNVTWDYSIGSLVKSVLNSQDPSAVCREYTYLQNIEGVADTYIVPREMAPADYGYNIIPVFPNYGATTINAKLNGFENGPSGGGGWSYGFVAVDSKGKPRYGDVAIESDGKATLNIESTDSLFYLVITGTPVKTNTYAWKPNWVKEYRFPYSLQFENALPAGHKDGYNSKKNSVAGAPHSNGGGWVATTATVDASAYVGPNAQVLETAKVQGNARIEDYAIVQGSSQVTGNAVVRGNAIVGKATVVCDNAVVEKAARVWGGKISENGVVTGSAVAFNCTISGNAVLKDITWVSKLNLSGTSVVGGNILSFAACSEGIYLSENQIKCEGTLWNDNYTADINQVVEEYYYPYGDMPQYPDNVQAKALSGTSVVLSWDEAPDNGQIINYIVFQSGKAIHLASGINDTITGLSPETAYTFSLRARDNAGNISEESEKAEVSTLVSTSLYSMDKFDFSAMPNPVTDHFTIDITGVENAELTIVNLVGEVVYENQISGKISLDRNSIKKSGIYFVKVKNGNTILVRKLVVR